MDRERRVTATSKLFKQGVSLILLRHEDDNLFAVDDVIAKNLKQSQELFVFFDNLEPEAASQANGQALDET